MQAWVILYKCQKNWAGPTWNWITKYDHDKRTKPSYNGDELELPLDWDWIIPTSPLWLDWLYVYFSVYVFLILCICGVHVFVSLKVCLLTIMSSLIHSFACVCMYILFVFALLYIYTHSSVKFHVCYMFDYFISYLSRK